MNYVARITHNRPTQILLSEKGIMVYMKNCLLFWKRRGDCDMLGCSEEIDITKQYDCAITCDPDNPTGKEVSQKLLMY